MKEKLIQLRNTMGLIETKGENTKIMANCLAFAEQLIQECDKPEVPEMPEEPIEE